eukprot:1414105-Prymnesium_polylepis.1
MSPPPFAASAETGGGGDEFRIREAEVEIPRVRAARRHVNNKINHTQQREIAAASHTVTFDTLTQQNVAIYEYGLGARGGQRWRGQGRWKVFVCGVFERRVYL